MLLTISSLKLILLDHVLYQVILVLFILPKICLFVWIFLETGCFACLLLLEELSIIHWTRCSLLQPVVISFIDI